jgi:hypothetical protein
MTGGTKKPLPPAIKTVSTGGKRKPSVKKV